ncbi:hypothetical protein HanRHA438_Chr13g0616881 [Helianthus annuus]|uniref:Uncharacterized protein n=1 Tax=Helianthus annuus TaxID=4232 RepID=A0A251SW41_HELAN|nr:hypothetical protein HanXRQr2_Chr13g0606391 [Helianthus annuus]KAJ0478172.1 hypothetical protein HanHA300_Chr13g0497281 [Helianthus annuus]KAJ0499055.1 hypothetical protein HanHA89_Chr13g0529941 [Helianthus annuus]KAJ0665069.1 hypothetical protein HanLR1_Chr13g0499971 [Helianthus annuus]KAJ0672488.1 hypothetical protein HanOQP8_Chr13g0497931 [Helianthus annuus]
MPNIPFIDLEAMILYYIYIKEKGRWLHATYPFSLVFLFLLPFYRHFLQELSRTIRN